MPGMDGFTLTEQIRLEPDIAGPVVMMLTSDDRQGDAARCRQLGLAGYMVKPIKRAELQSAIGLALAPELAGDPATKSGVRQLVGTQTMGIVTPPSLAIRAGDAPMARGNRYILVAEDNIVNQ